MGIQFLSTTDFHSEQIVEFNYSAINDLKKKDIIVIANNLVFEKSTSFGKIYRRKDNKDIWYIDSSNIARYITETQLALFLKWDSLQLTPTDNQFEVLKEIGGISSPNFSFDPPFVEFPVKILLNNQIIDFCLYRFSKSPPFQRHFKKIVFLDSVSEIYPSEFSLSHKLRLASTNAEEIKMSFYPFMVKTNKGDIITYDGRTQFASLGNLKGDEIVSEVPFSYKDFTGIERTPFEEATYVIGKWDHRIQSLFEEYKSLQFKTESEIKVVTPAKKSWLKRLF